MKKTNVLPLNPHVSVDCVIFGYDEKDLKILLIERKYTENEASSKKNKAEFALPGNLVRDDEDLDTSAKRILKELTGLDNIYLQQFYTFGNPDRVRNARDKKWLNDMRTDPGARVITVAYFALIKLDNIKTTPNSFARKSEWHSVSAIPNLAFDHNLILEKGLKNLREKIKHEPLVFELLPKKFTISQVQSVYEAILADDLDKRNFRRKLKTMKVVIPIGEKQKFVAHKPAELFQFDQKAFEKRKEEIL